MSALERAEEARRQRMIRTEAQARRLILNRLDRTRPRTVEELRASLAHACSGSEWATGLESALRRLEEAGDVHQLTDGRYVRLLPCAADWLMQSLRRAQRVELSAHDVVALRSLVGA